MDLRLNNLKMMPNHLLQRFRAESPDEKCQINDWTASHAVKSVVTVALFNRNHEPAPSALREAHL
jgi:hypothetical protein